MGRTTSKSYTTTLYRMNLKVPVLPFRSQAANMAELERWVRLAGGVIGTPLVYLVALQPLFDGWWLVGGMIVLAAMAIDLVVTGIRGFCPVYRFVTMPWTPRLDTPASSVGNGGPPRNEEARSTPRARTRS